MLSLSLLSKCRGSHLCGSLGAPEETEEEKEGEFLWTVIMQSVARCSGRAVPGQS